jgi:ribosomal protein L24
MDIGDKVKIIFGSDKGRAGIYFGMKNNSNWHIVKMPDGSELYVNLEEIEKI